MADPNSYVPGYSFSGYQASNPAGPLPAANLDSELESIKDAVADLVDAVKDVRRSDGKLKNLLVTRDALASDVLAAVDAVANLLVPVADAEAARDAAETARDAALNAQGDAEDARDAATTAQIGAESAQAAAEAAAAAYPFVSLRALAGTDAARFQAAANLGGIIEVPNGIYAPGTVTAGANPVFWWMGRARYSDGSPLDLPGVTAQIYGEYLLYKKPRGGAEDIAVVKVQRVATYSGGEGGPGGWSNAAVVFENVVGASANNNENAVLAITDSYGFGENNALFAQIHRRASAGRAWAATFEIQDYATANPTGVSHGIEVTHVGNGGDANLVRKGVYVAVHNRDSGGAVNELGHGFIVASLDGGRVKKAYSAEITFDAAFDTTLGTQATGGAALRIAGGQLIDLNGASSRRSIKYEDGYVKILEGTNTRVRIGDQSTGVGLDVNGIVRIDYTQVLTSRRTGWAVASGTKARSTFVTDSATAADVATRLGALIDDLTTHGLIGS